MASIGRVMPPAEERRMVISEIAPKTNPPLDYAREISWPAFFR
jgi:hypothetical protein